MEEHQHWTTYVLFQSLEKALVSNFCQEKRFCAEDIYSKLLDFSQRDALSKRDNSMGMLYLFFFYFFYLFNVLINQWKNYVIADSNFFSFWRLGVQLKCGSSMDMFSLSFLLFIEYFNELVEELNHRGQRFFLFLFHEKTCGV